MSPVSWNPPRRLDLEEWLHHGRRIGTIGRGTTWWIGDWMNYGNATFGEKYTRAARITGYDAQSLMNMAYVASRFEFSRRRENLSWSHHAEVAALPPEEQDHWLDIAAGDRLSVRTLRATLRARRAVEATGDTDREPRAVEAGQTVCPRCGHTIAENT